MRRYRSVFTKRVARRDSRTGTEWKERRAAEPQSKVTGEQSQVMLERLGDGVQNLYYICDETRATNRHGAKIWGGGEGGLGLANKIGARERLSVSKTN
jgi:mevalonate kinase